MNDKMQSLNMQMTLKRFLNSKRSLERLWLVGDFSVLFLLFYLHLPMDAIKAYLSPMQAVEEHIEDDTDLYEAKFQIFLPPPLP